MGKNIFIRLWNRLLDLIYPEDYHCLNCGSHYIYSEIQCICSGCLQKLHFNNRYCTICGRGLIGISQKQDVDKGKTKEDFYCNYCKQKSFNFEQARSTACYNGLIRELILRYKYEDCTEYKYLLGHLLYSYFKYYYNKEEIDLIIPIPLHKKRLDQRGYNQVQLLGEQLAKRSGLPMINDVLVRIDNNPPLYNYALKDRKRLLKNSFTVVRDKKGILSDSTVLLIDDIFTTGTTVDTVARELKVSGGVSRILVLTLATAITF